MKVVVYSQPFFPLMGGLERNTHTLCRALKDLGNEPHLLTETLSNQPDDYTFRVTRAPTKRTAAEIIREANLVLVNGGVSLKVLLFALMFNVRYGVIYHNYLSFRRKGNPWYSVWIRKLIAERAAVNVFTSSRSMELASLKNKSARVVLNPVDIELTPYYRQSHSGRQKQNETDYFLFAGRLIEGKGVFVLMDAIEEMDRCNHGEVTPRFVFAGTGPSMRALKTRASQLRRIEVKFPGRIDAEELVEMYTKAAALIVPSTTHKEGNPLVIAEALYAGTPVIASDQPPMIESVGEAGIIVPQGDATGLLSAMEFVIENVQERARLTREAEKRSALFSYEHYVSEVDNIVKQTQ
jgi:glycosyltransferase involved in cell wall biosynthesis